MGSLTLTQSPVVSGVSLYIVYLEKGKQNFQIKDWATSRNESALLRMYCCCLDISSARDGKASLCGLQSGSQIFAKRARQFEGDSPLPRQCWSNDSLYDDNKNRHLHFAVLQHIRKLKGSPPKQTSS